jgi:hypothetical protein
MAMKSTCWASCGCASQTCQGSPVDTCTPLVRKALRACSSVWIKRLGGSLALSCVSLPTIRRRMFECSRAWETAAASSR